MKRDQKNRAFGLLRQHGLRRNDRDLLWQFESHLGLPDMTFVAACRRQRPDLFVPDARHMNEAELHHAMRDLRVRQALSATQQGSDMTSVPFSDRAAMSRLRLAGLKHDDPDLLRVFAKHRSLPIDQFVQAAKAEAPSLFLPDVRELSPADYKAAWQQVVRPSPARRAVPAGTRNARDMSPEEFTRRSPS